MYGFQGASMSCLRADVAYNQGGVLFRHRRRRRRRPEKADHFLPVLAYCPARLEDDSACWTSAVPLYLEYFLPASGGGQRRAEG